jgi:hypothetical protein
MANEPAPALEASTEFQDADPTNFTGDELSWGDMFDGEEGETEVSADAAADETAETTEDTSQEPGEEVEEQPGVQTPPAQPVQTAPAAPAQSVTQPAPQPTAPPQVSSAPAQPAPKLHEVINTRFAELTQHLAESSFALPAAEAELFENPEVAQFVARRDAALYLRTMASVSQVMTEVLPGVVQSLIGVTGDVKRYETEFFDQHSDLNKPEYQPTLRSLLVAIKQNNPQITRQQMYDKLAVTARAYMGLPAQAPKVNGKAPATKPGVKTVSRVPFTPAAKGAGGSGGRQSGGARPAPANPIEALNSFLMKDMDE